MADRTIDALTSIQGSQIADDDSIAVFDKSAEVTKKATPAALRVKLGVGVDADARQEAAAAQAAADAAQATADAITPFNATKQTIYDAVKAIFHPATNAAVNADDANNELDVVGGDGTIINVPQGTASLALTPIESFDLSSGASGTLSITYAELPDVFLVEVDNVSAAGSQSSVNRYETYVIRKAELAETGGANLPVGGVAGNYVNLRQNGTAVDWSRNNITNGTVTLYTMTAGLNPNTPDGPGGDSEAKLYGLDVATDGSLTWTELRRVPAFPAGSSSAKRYNLAVAADGTPSWTEDTGGTGVDAAARAAAAAADAKAVTAQETADNNANVQADWDESDNTSDAFILNKPSIPSDDTVFFKMARAPAAGDSGTGKQGDIWFNFQSDERAEIWEKVSATEWLRRASGEKNNLPDPPAADSADGVYELQVASDGTVSWIAGSSAPSATGDGVIRTTPVGSPVAVSSANAVGPAVTDLNPKFLIEITYTRTNTLLHMWSAMLRDEDLTSAEYRLQLQGGGGAYISFYNNNGNVRISNAGATGYSVIVVRFFNESATGEQGPPGEGITTEDGRSRLLPDPTDLPNDKVMVTSSGHWIVTDKVSGGGGGGASTLHNEHVYDIGSTLYHPADTAVNGVGGPIVVPASGIVMLGGEVHFIAGGGDSQIIPTTIFDAEDLRALTDVNITTLVNTAASHSKTLLAGVLGPNGENQTIYFGINDDNELLFGLIGTSVALWPDIELNITASVISSSNEDDGPSLDDVVDIASWQGEFKEGASSNHAGRAYTVGQEFKTSTGYFRVTVAIAKGAVVTDVGNGANVEQLSGTALHIATFHEHIVELAAAYDKIFYPLKIDIPTGLDELEITNTDTTAVEDITTDIDSDRDLVHSIVAAQEAGIRTEMHISGKIKYYFKQNAPLSNTSGAFLSVNLWLGATGRSGAGASTAASPTPYLKQLRHETPVLADFRNSNGGRDAYGSNPDLESTFSFLLHEEDFVNWALSENERLTFVLLGNQINGFASVKAELVDVVITYDRSTEAIEDLREEFDDKLRALVQHQEIIVDELPDPAGAAAPDYAYLSRVWRPTQGFTGNQGAVEYSPGEYQRTTGTANRAKFLFSNGTYNDGNTDRDIIGFIQRGNRLRVGAAHFLSNVGEAIHNPVGGAVAGIFFTHDPSNVLAGGAASWVMWVKRSLASRKPPWNVPTNIEQGGFKVRLYHGSTSFDIKFAHGGSFEVIDGIEYEYYYAPTTTGLSWINNLNLNDIAASTIEIEFRRETDNQLFWLGDEAEGWTWRDPDENPTSISRIDKIERGSLIEGALLASLTGPASIGQLTNRPWTIPAGVSGVTQSNSGQHPTGNWTRYLYIDPDVYCHSLAGSHGILIVAKRGGTIVSSSYLPFTTAHAQWVADDEIFAGKWKTGVSHANTLYAGWGVDSGRLHLTLACSGADNQTTIEIHRTN